MTALPWKTLPRNELILKNFSTIMSYVFSTPALAIWLSPFGDSRFIYQACYNKPKKQANIALLELATRLRLLEDAYGLPETWQHTGGMGEWGNCFWKSFQTR
jgi:hypothetical protein